MTARAAKRAILCDSVGATRGEGVTTSQEINSFKWNDWAETVEVAYRPRRIPVSSRNEAMHKGARFWGVRFENEWKAVEDPNKRGAGESLVMTRAEPRQSAVRSMAKQVLASLALR